MDDDVPLSFRMGKKDNDREINEWYNEVKIGRQIGIYVYVMHRMECFECLDCHQ